VNDFDGEAPPIEPGPDVTPELFRVWRSPRLGAQNPERLTNPVWDWLVRSRVSASAAGQRFGVGGRPHGDPGWSFARLPNEVCATLVKDLRHKLASLEHAEYAVTEM
jgi:hypothetical protein